LSFCINRSENVDAKSPSTARGPMSRNNPLTDAAPESTTTSMNVPGSRPAAAARCRTSAVMALIVPTSVGYGSGAGGRAALLAMLNSCAPGIVVVNVDNGFGAGVHAARVARRAR
jgi:hypothetical protein